jgi:hypothetical protein
MFGSSYGIRLSGRRSRCEPLFLVSDTPRRSTLRAAIVFERGHDSA